MAIDNVQKAALHAMLILFKCFSSVSPKNAICIRQNVGAGITPSNLFPKGVESQWNPTK